MSSIMYPNDVKAIKLKINAITNYVINQLLKNNLNLIIYAAHKSVKQNNDLSSVIIPYINIHCLVTLFDEEVIGSSTIDTKKKHIFELCNK